MPSFPLFVMGSLDLLGGLILLNLNINSLSYAISFLLFVKGIYSIVFSIFGK